MGRAGKVPSRRVVNTGLNGSAGRQWGVHPAIHPHRPMWGKRGKTDGEVPSCSPQEKQVRHGSGASTQGSENRATRGPLKILMRWW